MSQERSAAQTVNYSSPSTPQTSGHRRDSLVVTSENGETTVTYLSELFDFGDGIVQVQPTGSVAFSETSPIELMGRHRHDVPTISNVAGIDTTCAIGGIPYEESVTTTGAKVYSIPFATAADLPFTPSVSLLYSSQAGSGVAGYGWTIGGLSSITLTGRNIHFHGIAEAASVDDPAFALDGVPLVENTSVMPDSFPYITARGNILVRITQSIGCARLFEVLFPDGRRAEYGVALSSSDAVLSYPLTRVEDTQGNYITYSYAEWDGLYHVTDIHYGGGPARSSMARIHFEYDDRTDYVDRHFCGRGYSERKLLKSVVSSDGGMELRSYSLSYENADGTCLLVGISCSVVEERLNPLSFEYGNGGPASDDFAVKDSLILSRSFSQSDTEFIYKRGKIAPDSSEDGIIIYPSFSTYDVREARWVLGRKVRYGSSYSPDQSILIFPYNRHFFSQARSIPCGEGFQTAEAVDVDGDGVDEIVRVNTGSTVSGRTDMRITVYEFDATSMDFIPRSFTAYVEGNVENMVFKSPSNLAFFFGDYVGDGKTKLLAYSFSDNGYGEAQTSKGTIIDLESGSVIKRQALFNLSISDVRNVFSLDIDADSKSEFCRLTASGMDAYSYKEAGGFNLEGSYAGITSGDISTNSGYTYITDLNSDGYVDIVTRNQSSFTWVVKSFDGVRFISGAFEVPHYAGDRFMFIDVNRDGLPDLTVVRSGVLHVHLNEGGIISSSLSGSHPVNDSNGIVPCNIASYNGIGSFIKVDGSVVRIFSFTRNLQERRLLTTFRDSFGVRLDNEYSEMSSCASLMGELVPEVYDIDESLPAEGPGFARVAMPVYLLHAEMVSIMGVGGNEQMLRDNIYRYFNAAASTLGLGFCGFRMIRATDARGESARWRSTRTYYDPEMYGCVIMEENVRRQTPSSTVRFTYDGNRSPGGWLNPRLVEKVEEDHLTEVVRTTTISYTGYDLPVTMLNSARIGNGHAEYEERISRVYKNYVTPSKYILGTVISETKTYGPPETPEGQLREHVMMTYDSAVRPLSRKMYVGPSGGALLSESRWQYDLHGNVDVELSAAYGASVFMGDSLLYDVGGRHLSSRIDAIGRSVTYGGHDRYGNPTQETDNMGGITTYAYDAWGTLTRACRPDGTEETETRMWSGHGDPGVMCVIKTTTGQPDMRIWYDAAGREVRSAAVRPDGEWQYVDSEYDQIGRIHRRSLPYKDMSEGATLWDTYGYDVYGRPEIRTAADGRQTTWSYSGTSTTITEDGISTVSTTDALGNVVSVEGLGGTISYALRADTKPISVTVTPQGDHGVVTTFSYDVFGRRTAMVDPSAGTRMTSYTDNADGTGSVTDIGPNGSVTSHYDRFGRITRVERPEFSTSYSYGTSSGSSDFSRLICETSTNGTGRMFAYDSLGRVQTEVSNVDSTHWMRKTYSYGAGSCLASVSYATQDGEITTEEMTYANGHCTGISIPGDVETFVWRLGAENSLGHPISVTTGTTERIYSYTPSGIPTGRHVIGNDGATIQDFSYGYDAFSGNMIWRQDSIHGYRESFTYDDFGRLISSTQAFYGPSNPVLDYGHSNAEYAPNGNMTYRDYDGLLDCALEYADPTDPYKVSGCSTRMEESVVYVPEYGTMAMTSFDRPASISRPESDPVIRFTYDASGERAKMTWEEEDFGVMMDRYYLGGVYEMDDWRNGGTDRVERLFLGGTAYDAPMVLVRTPSVNDGEWTPFNILRDVQGSISEIASLDGTVVDGPFRYDPWGMLISMGEINPDSLIVEIPNLDWALPDSLAGVDPRQRTGLSLYVGGHGYTGHEHIPGWGLINMNARFYDPTLCRFLSPDPLIQNPQNLQGFNRYSYCLNNPLRYTDESGEVVVEAILLGIFVSMVVDYGSQVVVNFLSGEDMSLYDLLIGNIDYMEVGVSGLIGGLTAGIGPAASSAKTITKLITNNLDYILAFSGAAINSMFSWTPNDGLTSFEDGFLLDFVSGLFSSALSVKIGDGIESLFKGSRLHSLTGSFRDLLISSGIGIIKNKIELSIDFHIFKEPSFSKDVIHIPEGH